MTRLPIGLTRQSFLAYPLVGLFGIDFLASYRNLSYPIRENDTSTFAMVALSSGAENIILNGLLCIILLVATVSNSLLLLVFYRRPGLRTISNRFVINLLVTNLITCWVLLPSMLADNVWRLSRSVETDDWRDEALSAVPCLLFEGAAVGLCVACVLSVVMIGVDQYFAVVDPLRYHASIKATTSVLMIIVSWAVAAVFGVLGAFSADGGCAWYACERLADSLPPSTPSPTLAGAGASSPLQLPQCYRLVFAGLFVAFAFVAPFGAICWIYLSICSAARQNHRRAKRHGSAASCGNGAPQEAALLEYASTIREYVEFDDADDGSPRPTPPPPSSTRSPPPPAPSACDSPAKPLHHSSTKGSLKSTSSSIVNSLRHRISNASMFRYREETRAARISVLVIVMALFCWLPFTLVLVARSPLLLARLNLPHYAKQMGILSLSSNAVVSPLIFAHRNRRIHRELCRLFRVSRRRASFYGIGDVKHATRRQRTPVGARRPPFRDSPPVAAAVDCERPVKRRDSSPALSPPDACAATAVAVATAAAVTAAAADSAAGAVAAKGRADDGRVVDHRVSILNRLWRASKEAERERHRKTFRLPEVAFETDTSRSSFSSNASTGSHHRSTSLASVSDAAADDY